MTIKTIKKATSTSIGGSSSVSSASSNRSLYEMPKSGGARRNLFNCGPDQEELKEQTKKLERENARKLKNYKIHSVIGVISDDRKLKSLPAAAADSRGVGRSFSSTHHTLQSMINDYSASSSSSSSSSTTTSYKSTESAKLLSTHKAINKTLPKGQTTIKDYFPTSKRSRHNQR